VAQGSPTVRRRELGTLLRKLRNEQGLTVEQVAERLLCSPSKVSRMETAHRRVTPRDLRDLCEVYGITDQAERDRLMALVRESKEPGWWQSYDLPYSTYVGLEAAATWAKGFHSSVVPGLLQTADYARALHEGAMPDSSTPELTPEVIDQRVAARLERQGRLTQEESLNLWTVLDEAVLHRMVGGPSIMGTQLLHLAKASAMPNVTVQVIPYSVGAHPALESTFYILEFADVPDVIYVEGLVGWMYLDHRQDLDRYQKVFTRLCDIALTPEESVRLINEIRKSCAGDLRTSTVSAAKSQVPARCE
jgi:transcriptional regulator with XRE-family HTH domain